MSSELLKADRTGTNSLDEKTCVITGSSRGIGREIAIDFARHGATVVVNYRSSTEAAESVGQAIESQGAAAKVVRADVGDFDAVQNMRERIHDEFGGIDVLVNNAGITRDVKFEHMTPEEWNRVITTNLTGIFNCTKVFFEDIKQASDGRVINISSVVGRNGNVGQVNYAAAKSGLFGFTRALAHELAPHGSTANCVAPGYTNTDMVEQVRDDICERIKRDIPMERFGSVQEIACVVRFLASEASSYMTGEIVDVNGGMYM